jgi:VanZ family protein
LFAAYISLVPFNFTRPTDATLIEAFQRSLDAERVSRANFAGNVVLFGPLGFFAAGALLRAAQPRGRRLLRTMALVASSVMLSLAIEFLQVLVPGRMPALSDVTAQTAGMVAGMGAWLLVSRDILRWAERRRSDRGHDALRLGLMVFAAGRAIAMMLPLDVTLDLGLLAEKYRNGLVVLNPMWSPAISWNDLPALLADGALSVPIGVLACLAGMLPGRRRRAGLALLLGWAFVGLLEAAQVFVVSRTADVVDWCANATGVTVGVWWTTRFLPARLGRALGASQWTPIAGLAGSLAFYVLYHWSPFDFTLSEALVRPRIPLLFGVPFHSYYQNPEIKAVGEVLVKIALGIPVGLFLSWWISRSPAEYRRLVVVTATMIIVSLFAVVEAGQILLVTRYPDNTDILLGLAGVLVGHWVVRGLGQEASA